MTDFKLSNSVLHVLIDPIADLYQVFPDRYRLEHFARTGDQDTARVCLNSYEFEMTLERMNYDPETDDFYYQFVLARFVELDKHEGKKYVCDICGSTTMSYI